ncbi:tRNA splicing endonuclease subunit [Starmerella bacillaris]|uniref:tRNA splicing endonuclease subunit n=1 Tax=Starmerella bacillaris TaxID=1247836 RepID=A0AAV5RHD6_STABA|nr:tRNA splicing endonuclease subunit [Starmerella bacillaris]
MESDSDDGGQDWTLLGANVLKRGEKDHAPDGTVIQQTQLQKSREVMYTALSEPVVISEKNLVEADWDSVRNIGRVRKQKGTFFMTMGWSEHENVYLYPEEVIYLCQRGSMRCYLNNEPLSVEGVMSICLKYVSTEWYDVYSNFKKLGFIVRRCELETRKVSKAQVSTTQTVPSQKSGRKNDNEIKKIKNELSVYYPPIITRIAWFLLGSRFNSFAWRPSYIVYSTLFKDLTAVKVRQNIDVAPQKERFDFFVYKPGTKFKKSDPPEADYRIRVVSADQVPELNKIEKELQIAQKVGNFYKDPVKRMRLGYRTFIYAVVDNGVISYVKVTETGAPSVY